MRGPTDNRSRTTAGRTLGVLAAALYVVAGLTWVVGRGISRRSSDDRFARADFAAEDLVFDPTAIPAVAAKRSPPIDLAAAVAGSPEMLARGRTLFQHSCAPCHGPEGHGDGPAGAGLRPPPRDFSSPSGWKNGTRLSDIFRTVSRGIPGTAMMAYDTLTASDRLALAHAVTAFGDFPHQPDTAASIAALDRDFSLSRGKELPGRIPVARAVERLEAESRPPRPLELPAAWRNTERGRLLALAIAEPLRAMETLTRNPEWRGDPAALARLASSGTPGNGFSSSVATLDGEQWRELGAALDQVIGR